MLVKVCRDTARAVRLSLDVALLPVLMPVLPHSYLLSKEIRVLITLANRYSDSTSCKVHAEFE